MTNLKENVLPLIRNVAVFALQYTVAVIAAIADPSFPGGVELGR